MVLTGPRATIAPHVNYKILILLIRNLLRGLRNLIEYNKLIHLTIFNNLIPILICPLLRPGSQSRLDVIEFRAFENRLVNPDVHNVDIL